MVSALLGLVRAAYEEKNEYFASLASNILRSARRALDAIQKTNESVYMTSYSMKLVLGPENTLVWHTLSRLCGLVLLSLDNFIGQDPYFWTQGFVPREKCFFSSGKWASTLNS